MPVWLLFLKGDTLGKTVYNVLKLLAALGVVAWLVFALVTGRIYEWRLNRATDRAETAEATAQVATKAAADSDAAAVNATDTRGRVDRVVVEVQNQTQQAVERARNYEGSIPADGSLPADLVRELEEARTRATTAANRLQRTGTGGTSP